MPKTIEKGLSKELLEQIYAEVEIRVGRVWEERFRKLERENERLKEERDLWQKKYFKQVEVSEQLQGHLALANARIAELEKKVEQQDNRIKALLKQLHGKKSEAAKPTELPEALARKRARGRQPGAKGHGRKKRDTLTEVEVIHDFEASERACLECGAEYSPLGVQTSEEIDVEYRLVKLIHKRKKIVRSCKCTKSPTVKTAQGPDKLAAGGMFTTRFWAYLIFEKFQLQRPTHRVRQLWKAHGLDVSQGTITNGLKRLHERNIFKPLADAIRARIREGSRQQSDETGWKVFQEIEGKEGYQHWLWVTVGADSTAFRVEPTRSKESALKMIGKQPTILTSDRLSS
jgi:transposase